MPDHGLIDGFERPTALPASAAEAERWQEANRQWWESHPMEYDWSGTATGARGTPAFYERIDQAFLTAAQTFLPARERAFDQLIPYGELPTMDVLEIGIGSGTHAALIAAHARTFTGIDLTAQAVANTQGRFTILGLDGDLRQMDAERLDFPDSTFDFVWSWGVLHHSANTPQILAEIRRVLRPGGRAVVMVYHRSFWGYFVMSGLIRGLLTGDLLRTRSLHRTVQRGTDGALARYYSPREWRSLAATQGLPVERLRICGDKPEMIPLPSGRIKTAILAALPDAVSRFFLNRLRQGSFLIASHRR
ncbi:MAG: hypothetical protein JWO79_2632 [Actinomycetia bacterium]|jgi:ubiquinone/menaquinone biosynthesis C-methylase UbiE|nr:hypothetical protein [Actinomycetes bacterium]